MHGMVENMYVCIYIFFSFSWFFFFSFLLDSFLPLLLPRYHPSTYNDLTCSLRVLQAHGAVHQLLCVDTQGFTVSVHCFHPCHGLLTSASFFGHSAQLRDFWYNWLFLGLLLDVPPPPTPTAGPWPWNSLGASWSRPLSPLSRGVPVRACRVEGPALTNV